MSFAKCCSNFHLSPPINKLIYVHSNAQTHISAGTHARTHSSITTVDYNKSRINLVSKIYCPIN